MTDTGLFLATADKRSLIQIVRFAIVGLANTATALALVWLFHVVMGMGVLTASGGAYAAASVQSYLLNLRWTFAGAEKRAAGPQFLAFIAVNIICGAMFSFLNEYLERTMDVVFSTAIAIAVTFPLSFGLNRLFVFIDERR